jgi:superoxide dismutase, Fe-Mn family
MQHGSLAQLKSSFSAAALGMFTSGWVWFVVDKHGNTGVIPTFGPGTLLVRSRSYIANAKELLLGEDLAQLFRGDPLLPHIYAEEDFKDAHGQSVDTPARAPVSQRPSPSVTRSSSPSGVGAKSPTRQDPPLPRFYHNSAPSSSNLGNVMPTSVWGEDPDPLRSGPKSKDAALNIGEYLTPLFCVSVNEHAWMAAGYGVWGKEEWLKKFWTVLDWQKVSRMHAYAVPDKASF